MQTQSTESHAIYGGTYTKNRLFIIIYAETMLPIKAFECGRSPTTVEIHANNQQFSLKYRLKMKPMYFVNAIN